MLAGLHVGPVQHVFCGGVCTGKRRQLYIAQCALNLVAFCCRCNRVLSKSTIAFRTIRPAFKGTPIAGRAHQVPDDNPLFFGRPGTYGQRSANLVIQNCDLLISIGSRLSIPLVGRNTKAFARVAHKVVVDIDSNELEKPTLKPDFEGKTCSDLHSLLEVSGALC